MKHRDTVLDAVRGAFLAWPRPPRVTKNGADTPEYRSIEADFGGRKREELSYPECSMLLVDGAMVTPEAFFYFLPRLAEAVLHEEGDWVLLGLRLDALGTDLLNSEQADAVSRLHSELESLEKEMDDG